MAYTTPATHVAGTVWSSSFWNTYGRDNIAWIATDSPACRSYHSAAYGIANNAATPQIFDSERFDNAAMHSTSTNTTRLTVPVGGAGKYLMGGALQWQVNATGTRIGQIELNGTTNVGEDTTLSTAAVSPVTSPVTVYAMSASDYVELIAYQDSGGGLNVLSGPNISPEFWAYWFRT